MSNRDLIERLEHFLLRVPAAMLIQTEIGLIKESYHAIKELTKPVDGIAGDLVEQRQKLIDEINTKPIEGEAGKVVKNLMLAIFDADLVDDANRAGIALINKLAGRIIAMGADMANETRLSNDLTKRIAKLEGYLDIAHELQKDAELEVAELTERCEGYGEAVRMAEDPVTKPGGFDDAMQSALRDSTKLIPKGVPVEGEAGEHKYYCPYFKTGWEEHPATKCNCGLKYRRRIAELELDYNKEADIRRSLEIDAESYQSKYTRNRGESDDKNNSKRHT
jgi:hypothetical protein